MCLFLSRRSWMLSRKMAAILDFDHQEQKLKSWCPFFMTVLLRSFIAV